MTELCDLSARQLVAGYRKGAFTPVDAARAVLDRIEVVQPGVNAFVRVDSRPGPGAGAGVGGPVERG